MNKDKKYFRTANFYAAVFLYTQGAELIDIDKSDPKHAQFVFTNTHECQSLFKSFNYGRDGDSELQVDARKYSISIKRLKSWLYDGI